MKKETVVVSRRVDRRIARIARHYGLLPQLAKTCEELRELHMAIWKLRLTKWIGRKTAAQEQHVLEKIADVRIMLDQIELLTGGNQSCSEWRTAKLERQVQRINGEQKCITSKTSSHFS